MSEIRLRCPASKAQDSAQLPGSALYSFLPNSVLADAQ